MATCKKCGKEITRIWVNKRQQRMGKCTAAGCGKMVYLGKAEKPAGSAGHEQQEEAPRAKARGKKTKQRPRPIAASRAGAGSGEQHPPRSRTFFERVTDFLDREW